MTTAEKIDYVTSELLPMLKNDLRVVVESGCPKHGCGSGPNFTVALLCMVACEAVGALSAPPGVRDEAATRAFLVRVGEVVNDRRYGQLAGLLIALFRNGVAHSFLPKQTQRLAGTTMWDGPCIDDLQGTAAGQLRIDSLRLSVHLTITPGLAPRQLRVVTKVLYLDILRTIEAFEVRLLRRDATEMASFELAFDDWVAENSRVKGKLSDYERSLL